MKPADERESPHRRNVAGLLLPTRAAALEGLRTALLRQEGPVLITGEAGVGKTWLARRLESELTSPWRWAHIDLTPATDVAELFGAISRGVGLAEQAGRSARWRYVDALAESAAEGERWVLVVEEAHNASDPIWEEIRILANHLGERGGFAGIVLVGQTPLARRLRTRALAALESRLAYQVHLRPLDRDEAIQFLEHEAPARIGSNPEGDSLHRDAAGNPRRLVHAAIQLEARGNLVRDVRPSPPKRPAAAEPVALAEPVAVAAEPNRPMPIPVPSKPPLHEEEGLIEVGWDASDLEPSDESLGAAVAGRSLPDTGVAVMTEEPVDDHYAALQAWTEWAKNQGRASAPAPADGLAAVDDDDEGGQSAAESDRLSTNGHPSVWAEGQHGFAPYSQLFSRLRQSRDSL